MKWLLSLWWLATVVVLALDYVMDNMPEEAGVVLEDDKLLQWYPDDLALITLPSYKPRRLTRGLQLKPGDVLLRGYDSMLLKPLLLLLNFGLGSWSDAPGEYFGFIVIGRDEGDAEEWMGGRRWYLPEPPMLTAYDYGYFPKVQDAAVSLLESYGASLAKREVCGMRDQKECKSDLREVMPFRNERAVMIRNAFKPGASLLDVAKVWAGDLFLSQILQAAVRSIEKESSELHRTFLGRLYLLNIINCPSSSQECLKLAKQLAASFFPANAPSGVIDWTSVSGVMPEMVQLGFLNFQSVIEQMERDISKVNQAENFNSQEGEVTISEENLDALLHDIDFELQEGGIVRMIRQKSKGLTPAMKRAQSLLTNLVVDRSDKASGIEIFRRLADARHGEHALAKFILDHLPAQFLTQIQYAANANFAIQTEAVEVFDPRTPIQPSDLSSELLNLLMKPTMLFKLTRVASALLEKGSHRDFKKLKVNWEGASSGNVWCHGLQTWGVAKDVNEYAFEAVSKREPALKCLVWDGKDALSIKSADASKTLQLLHLPTLSLFPFKGKVPSNHALIINGNKAFAKAIEGLRKELNWDDVGMEDKLPILFLYLSSKVNDVPLIAAN